MTEIPIKGLTLTQPWASEMALLHKRYETRSWPTKYRGILAIHAAKGFPGWAKDLASTEIAIGRLTSPLPVSQIVCVVAVEGCYRTEDVDLEISALERYLGDYTPGRWAWKTKHLYTLRDPIPCRGALGLWEVPDDVREQIATQWRLDEGVIA